ncbi:unnamed protein product [Rhizophagus irregularis]|nr:unnamed protein product [Rhizophagus irregularis]
MEIQRIRSALRFGSQVRLSGDFRRMEIQRIRSALGFSWLLSSEEQRKIKIRLGCLRFLSVSAFISWALDIWVSAFGYWALNIWISAFGYWALDRFPLRTYIEQIGFPLRIFG